jgi:polysaccharide export outer membrane protein
MAKNAALTLAIPAMLACWMLARSALQPPPALPAVRVEPALVYPRTAPPAGMAPTTGADPVTIRSPSAGSALPIVARPIEPAAAENASRAILREPPRPSSGEPEPLYPITDAVDGPTLAPVWPGPVAPADGSAQVFARPFRAAARPREHQAPLRERPLAPSAADPASARRACKAANVRALKLAQRGALYSARCELLAALADLAGALDAARPQPMHGPALSAALAALEELHDFSRTPAGRPQALRDMILTHQTPVLKEADASQLTAPAARAEYVAFAGRQLTQAAASEAAAADSLFLLGQIHGMLGQEKAADRVWHECQAVAMHQAALAIHPRHHQAANELGVLLARGGQLLRAREALLASVSIEPTAEAWSNLAIVHERLGEEDLAERARYESELLADSRQAKPAQHGVQWVDARTFDTAGTSDHAAAIFLSACTALGVGRTVGRGQRLAQEVIDNHAEDLGERMPPVGGPVASLPLADFGPGEYPGPPREPHVPEYRLRVDDELEFTCVLTREVSEPYRLQVGDTIRVESAIDPGARCEVPIQPDGTVDLYLLGAVQAARLTVGEFKSVIDERYRKYYKVSDFSVTRVRTSARLMDLRDAVDSRREGGERRVRVNPAGAISLPELGEVHVQGLSLAELRREINERYAQVAPGLSITPNLARLAPRHVYVAGEVHRPGRYVLESPTSVLAAVALAGGWKHSANLRQVAVYRRGEDWGVIATKIDLSAAARARGPGGCDLFLRDEDVVVVPKSSILCSGDCLVPPCPQDQCHPFSLVSASRL